MPNKKKRLSIESAVYSIRRNKTTMTWKFHITPTLAQLIIKEHKIRKTKRLNKKQTLRCYQQ